MPDRRSRCFGKMATSNKLSLSGFPIGIFDDATYEEWSVRLNTGDILLFFSDGLTEAANREGKFFGTHRIKDILAANAHLNSSELADRLLEEVEKFHARGRHHGRSHAGGDESQVSAASSQSRSFPLRRLCRSGQLYSRVFLSRFPIILRRCFRRRGRKAVWNARVSVQPREHRASLSPHGFRVRQRSRTRFAMR